MVDSVVMMVMQGSLIRCRYHGLIHLELKMLTSRLQGELGLAEDEL